MFKSGERVRCIDDSGFTSITTNELYEIIEPGTFMIEIRNDSGSRCAYPMGRFEVYEAQPSTDVNHLFSIYQDTETKAHIRNSIEDVLPLLGYKILLETVTTKKYVLESI